jgi:hypothetical protein
MTGSGNISMLHDNTITGKKGSHALMQFLIRSAVALIAVALNPSALFAQSCILSTSYQDGCANAPAGTPQYPTLLGGYAVRPPWRVAGVDFHVGIDANTTLKDPLPNGSLDPVLVSQGCIFDGISVNCRRDNQTIQGWDFALHGGLTLRVQASNITIKNNNFALGANNASNPRQGAVIGASNGVINTTIINNVMDGRGLGTIGIGILTLNSSGTLTVEYNWIKNAFAENIVIGVNTASGFNFVVQYNVIENAGLGYSQGAHGDWVQNVIGSNSDKIDSMNFNFNTWIQSLNASGTGQPRTQGITFPSTGQVLSESVNNNTFIVTSSAYVNFAVFIDPSYLNGSATLEDNYVDPSGLGNPAYGGGAFVQISNRISGSPGPYHGTVKALNNVNMLRGTYYNIRYGKSQRPY